MLLTDSNIIDLKKDKLYQEAMKIGLKGAMKDIFSEAADDLKTSPSFFYKLVLKFTKRRYIRHELSSATETLLLSVLNYELLWDRIPESVETILQSDQTNSIWLRFDVPRVNAVFSRGVYLLEKAEYRNLIKTYSIKKEKDKKLKELKSEILVLKDATIDFIEDEEMVLKQTHRTAKKLYRQNRKQIADTFRENLRRGLLEEPKNKEDEPEK